MKKVVKSATLTLFMLLVFGIANATASTSLPLFLTESKSALLFTTTGGAVKLRAKRAGSEGSIKCEKESTHGFMLDKSTLVRELHIQLEGKCEQEVTGNKGTCTEPIKLNLSYGELGVLNDHVYLLVALETGTVLTTVNCTNGTTEVDGAVIGELPLTGADGNPQYDENRTDFLLSFKANGTKQEPEEIELLGALMKGVGLKVEGFLGEKAALESHQLLLVDGEALVDSPGPQLPPLPLFLTESKKALLFTTSGGRTTLRAEKGGVIGTIACERNSAHGFALDKTTLVHELHIELKGKCEQTLAGTKTACTEPILFHLSYGELGILNDHVDLLIIPETKTEFATITCGSNTTTLAGAVLGEFPLTDGERKLQYDVNRENFLLAFRANGIKQELEETELLGGLMKAVALKVEGFFGGKATLESHQLLSTDGQTLLDSPGPQAKPISGPEFLTESEKALLFTITGGESILRGERAGVEGEIFCKEDSAHGYALNESPLVRELHLEFKGECRETVGSTENACTEPIKLALSAGELGLLHGHVYLLVVPEKGTEFGKIKCGETETTVGGAVLGEFPLTDNEGGVQYDEDREGFLFEFNANGIKQEPEEVELLGVLMKGLSLKLEGFFGGKGSLESHQLLLFDGKAAIASPGPQGGITGPLFLTESKKALLFSVDSGSTVVRGGLLGELIRCEKELVHGFILDKSTLLHELHIQLEGKCEVEASGSKTGCTEPIMLSLSFGRLGLLNGHVDLLIAPEKGTELTEVKCTDGTDTLEGAFIGEFKLNGRGASSQYGVLRKEFLLLFRTSGTKEEPKQEPNEIELLGILMTNVGLRWAGFLGKSGALESTQLLLVDGEVLIDP